MSEPSPIYVAIIDDDESQCRALSRLLRATGVQSISYSSAESFLADEQHPQFDCLVLDIQLPGASGIELKKHLAFHGSHIPVIFVTAYDELEVRREALDTGCAAFFRKTESGSTILQGLHLAIANAVDRQTSTVPGS